MLRATTENMHWHVPFLLKFLRARSYVPSCCNQFVVDFAPFRWIRLRFASDCVTVCSRAVFSWLLMSLFIWSSKFNFHAFCFNAVSRSEKNHSSFTNHIDPPYSVYSRIVIQFGTKTNTEPKPYHLIPQSIAQVTNSSTALQFRIYHNFREFEHFPRMDQVRL